MITPIYQRGLTNARSIEEQAVNKQEIKSGASITIEVPNDKILFIIKAYGGAITQISEDGVNTNCTPVGDIAFPFLRFDKDVVITGVVSTNVVYMLADRT